MAREWKRGDGCLVLVNTRWRLGKVRGPSWRPTGSLRVHLVGVVFCTPVTRMPSELREIEGAVDALAVIAEPLPEEDA